MKISISGASGFVGTYLTTYFTHLGHQVVPLGRSYFQEEGSRRLVQVVEQSEVVINLAGASINKRWSEAYIQEMYNSRISVTRQLVKAMHQARVKPHLFISVSAVGYYATEGCADDYFGEKGQGILSDLCEAWEGEAVKCPREVRLVTPRLGVVLARQGGALEQMLLPLRYFKLATVIAPGSQPFPWIGLEDLARAFDFFIHDQELSGVVNLVAPEQCSQREFMQVLANHYRAIATVTLPGFLFKVRYGKGAIFLTTGQCVIPAKLTNAGFLFTTPTIELFCREQLARR
ncbi:MAG: TIGR01777 family oxidoreductase [Phocaeicola sp.]